MTQVTNIAFGIYWLRLWLCI